MNNSDCFIGDDETVEDLQIAGLYLIQKKHGFRFGADAVLLSDFAKGIRSRRTLDLCTGTGIVATLLAAKTQTPQIDALEIVPEIAEMAARSVELNSLGGRIAVKCGDLKEYDKFYPKRSFDVITCNPPYAEAGKALTSADDINACARHEIFCTLEDVVAASSKLLVHGGHLVMVHRPKRLIDCLTVMRSYDIEPKRIRFVYPSVDKPPNMMLIDGTYKGGRELKLLPPLIMFDENGNYSKEIDEIYGRGQ